jgi:hypothetical protein
VDLYIHSPNTPSWHGVQFKKRKHRVKFNFTFNGQMYRCQKLKKVTESPVVKAGAGNTNRAVLGYRASTATKFVISTQKKINQRFATT